MKKIILTLMLLILIPSAALAWDDCPFGEEDCEGLCSRFVDTDNDGICDHSQPAPEDRVAIVVNEFSDETLLDSAQSDLTAQSEVHDLIDGKDLKDNTVKEIAVIYEIDEMKYAGELSEHLGTNVKPEQSFQLLHDNYGLEPGDAKDIAAALKLGVEVQLAEKESSTTMTYHLIPIFAFLTFLYLLTWFLSKKKVITLMKHRQIWNILLLITFLVSGLLGVLLVIKINFSIAIPFPFNIMFWHVEAGIAMFAISVFHTWWHWPYFRNMFRRT